MMEGGSDRTDEGFVVDFNADQPVVPEGPYTEARETVQRVVGSRSLSKKRAAVARMHARPGRQARGCAGSRKARNSRWTTVDREGDPVARRLAQKGGDQAEKAWGR